jgi:hypothetical protein
VKPNIHQKKIFSEEEEMGRYDLYVNVKRGPKYGIKQHIVVPWPTSRHVCELI